MDQQLIKNSKLYFLNIVSVKKLCIVIFYIPETKWSNYEQVELLVKKVKEDWTRLCCKILDDL